MSAGRSLRTAAARLRPSRRAARAIVATAASAGRPARPLAWVLTSEPDGEPNSAAPGILPGWVARDPASPRKAACRPGCEHFRSKAADARTYSTERAEYSSAPVRSQRYRQLSVLTPRQLYSNALLDFSRPGAESLSEFDPEDAVVRIPPPQPASPYLTHTESDRARSR